MDRFLSELPTHITFQFVQWAAFIIHFASGGLWRMEWRHFPLRVYAGTHPWLPFAWAICSSTIGAMPYMIDGHNLIPKLGLRLDSPDDEMQLVAIIQEFARLSRREAEVYFDGAPAGQARSKRFGTVTAHFIRIGSSADAAIKFHLKRLGHTARNWTVITSDRDVQTEARAAHAVVISSEEFAGQLNRLRAAADRPAGEPQLSAQEISEWLKLFGGRC